MRTPLGRKGKSDFACCDDEVADDDFEDENCGASSCRRRLLLLRLPIASTKMKRTNSFEMSHHFLLLPTFYRLHFRSARRSKR